MSVAELVERVIGNVIATSCGSPRSTIQNSSRSSPTLRSNIGVSQHHANARRDRARTLHQRGFHSFWFLIWSASPADTAGPMEAPKYAGGIGWKQLHSRHTHSFSPFWFCISFIIPEKGPSDRDVSESLEEIAYSVSV